MQKIETLFSKSQNYKFHISHFSVKFSNEVMAYCPCLVPFVFPCQAFQEEAVNLFPTTVSAATLLFSGETFFKAPVVDMHQCYNLLQEIIR